MLKVRVRVVVVAVIAAALGAVVTQEVWRAFSFNSEKDWFFPGIWNFGRVNAHLYRGAQPSPAGYAALKHLGVDTVVRLSLGDEGSTAEEKEVTALGMSYVSIPMTTARVPTSDQTGRFLHLIHDHPTRTFFVHCKSGADRTGVMIALSRIAFDHWSAARAIDEMNAFHYHVTFLPHLQRYVENFQPARDFTDDGK